MNFPDLVASFGYAVKLGLIAAIVFCAIVGGIVVLGWAMGRRSR